MKTLSIEYAHIYTNKQINEEQRLSVDVLKEFYESDKSKDDDISLVVLVDDYSFPDPSFNYGEFSEWLTKQGFKPDLIFLESALTPTCDIVLNEITNKRLQSELSDYVANKKYPCSLFISAWYLIRLGYITQEGFDTSLVAEKLVNILPVSFKPYEDKALEIIESTRFANAVSQIEHRYFEGREIE